MEKLFEKCDGIVLKNFHSYWKDPLVNKYLTTSDNSGISPSERFEGFLVLKKATKPLWLSHPFNYNQSKKVLTETQVKEFTSTKSIQVELNRALKGCKKIGYNSRYYSAAGLLGLKKILKGKKLVDATSELEKSREIKTPAEIKCIKKAVLETQKLVEEIKLGNILGEAISEGKTTETDLASIIRYKFEKDGFECAFCIVAFGENTKNLHHTPTDALLKEGPVLIDIGAKYKGYCADISESFWFGKNESAEYASAKRKVSECLLNVEKLLKEGTNSKALWDESVKCIGKMPHSLGHGLGIEEHDLPHGISEKGAYKLKEGMVLAIEPGIYNNKFGIRIEADYLITKKGFEKL
ncbi:MAG: Xaa-Pro peptidase family protein [archaeon]